MAVGTFIKNNVIAEEITANADVDYEEVALSESEDLGYTNLDEFEF